MRTRRSPATSRKLWLAYYVVYRHGSWAWKDKTVRRRGRGRAHRVGAASRLTGRATAAVVPSLRLRSTASSSNSSGGNTTHPAPTRQLNEDAIGQLVLVGSWPQVTHEAAQLSGTSSTSWSSSRPWALDCSGGAMIAFYLIGVALPNASDAARRASASKKQQGPETQASEAADPDSDPELAACKILGMPSPQVADARASGARQPETPYIRTNA